jgi:acylphosphatase
MYMAANPFAPFYAFHSEVAPFLIANCGPTRASLSSLTVAGGLALVESRVCGLWGEAAVHEEQRAKRYYISGSVQGVGYRYFAKRSAERLGAAGYAKNLRDGRVEVYAVGTDAMHAALRAELERGPRVAMVSGVAEEDAPLEADFAHEFSIEHETW